MLIQTDTSKHELVENHGFGFSQNPFPPIPSKSPLWGIILPIEIHLRAHNLSLVLLKIKKNVI